MLSIHMIDKLQRIAKAIQILRLPSLFVGATALALLVVIILVLAPPQGDRLVIPCIVGLLWGLSMYVFIVTFGTVPERPGPELTFFSKLKQKFVRTWYGLIGLFFIGATIAIIIITIRMVLIWLRSHGG